MLTRLLLLFLIFASLTDPGHAATPRPRASAPLLWARGPGKAPHIPLVGDVNGDRYADLIFLSARGKCRLEVAMNDQGRRSLPLRRLLSDFGQDCIAAATGSLDGDLCVIALFRNGEVRVASQLTTRPKQQVWGRVLRKGLPDRAWLAVAEGDHLRAHALLVVYPDGAVEQMSWAFPRKIESDLTLQGHLGIAPRDLVFARFLNLAFELHFPDGSGRMRLHRLVSWGLPLDATAPGANTQERATRLRKLWRSGLEKSELYGRNDPYAIARAKLLRGLDGPREFYNNPAMFPELEQLAWTKPSVLLAGDIDGDGERDLVRFRQDDDPHGGADVLVYCMRFPHRATARSRQIVSAEPGRGGAGGLSR